MEFKEFTRNTWNSRFLRDGAFSDNLLYRNSRFGEGIPLPYIEYHKNLLLGLVGNLNRSFGRTISRPFIIATFLFGSNVNYCDTKNMFEDFGIPYNPVFGVMLWGFLSIPFRSPKYTSYSN